MKPNYEKDSHLILAESVTICLGLCGHTWQRQILKGRIKSIHSLFLGMFNANESACVANVLGI